MGSAIIITQQRGLLGCGACRGSHWASFFGIVDGVATLIGMEGDINSRVDGGSSPLPVGCSQWTGGSGRIISSAARGAARPGRPFRPDTAIVCYLVWA